MPSDNLYMFIMDTKQERSAKIFYFCFKKSKLLPKKLLIHFFLIAEYITFASE